MPTSVNGIYQRMKMGENDNPNLMGYDHYSGVIFGGVRHYSA
ncbi:MAG: hypothetical protein AB8G95_24515 [Anaerolineae bacterium]